MKEKVLYIATSLLSRFINGKKKVKDHDVKTILLVKLDDIGDMVYTLHVFEMLHEQYPEAQIDLRVKKVNRIFFKHIHYVNLLDNKRKLERKDYDLMFDLRGNFRSLRFAFRNNVKFYFDRGSVRLKNKYTGQKQEVYTNHEIIQAAVPDVEFRFPQIHISANEEKFVSDWLTENSIQKYAVIHAGANSVSRRWPVDCFSKVIDWLKEELDLDTVLVGGPNDLTINHEIEQIAQSKVFHAAGELDLLQLSALCRKASIFIGNESGPLHVATASSTPVVGIFGPGVKDVFYPYHERSKVLHRFSDNEKLKTGLPVTTISVEEVCEAIRSLAV